MDGRLAPWSAALVFAVAAAGMAITGQNAAAIVLASTALAMLLLSGRRTLDDETAAQALHGVQAVAAALTDAIDLQGRGVHIPDPTTGDCHLFVPANDDTPLPNLEPGRVLLRGPSGVAGAVVTPPGHGLWRQWRTLAGSPSGTGVEAATHQLRRALPALGLGRRVRVLESADHIQVRYQPLGLEGACRDAAGLAPWDVQGGCPTTSLVACLLATGMGRPVRLLGVARETADVVITAEWAA